MDSRRIEPERLDLALERLGPAAPRTPGAERTDDPPFVLPPGGLNLAAGAFRDTSLHDDIVDFVIPRISDPGILRCDRSVALLEHLVSDLLQQLAESPELRALATTVVSEEITRHRDLMARMYEAVEG
jgi:hypothetical protein